MNTPGGNRSPWWLSWLIGWFAILVVCVGAWAVLIQEPRFQRARVDKTRLDIGMLDTALRVYALKTGHFPDGAEGLRPLVATGVLTAEPHDGWDRRYRYTLVAGRPVITSYGRDGRPGGEGPDADISSLPPDRSDFGTQVRTR